MGNTLAFKLAEAMAKRKTRYVVCVEGKYDDVYTLYKLMSNEEQLQVALGNDKMYIICENNEQADATARLLNHENGLYAHLV